MDYIVNRILNMFRNLYYIILPNYLHKKIFVISFQRTGTTSTGAFFKDFNYKVATYSASTKNKWTLSFFKGDYNKIFNSKDFKLNQVFEDDPWWLNDFYKVLYHKFPSAKFVLLTRNTNNWYNSMMNHSNKKNLGNTHIHCNIYERDYHSEDKQVFNDILKNSYSLKTDNLLPLNENHKSHYINIYERRNNEIKLFFDKHDGSRCVCLELEDEEKWNKLGKFFNLKVPEAYNSMENVTKK